MRNTRDFWAGVIYLGVASAALWISRDYPAGSALKMGPGYFPRLLALGLGFIGLISIGRAFLRYGAPVENLEIKEIKKLLGILAAIILGGMLLPIAGIVIALPVLILISALVGPKFHWKNTLLLIIALTVFSLLIFVQGLGVPMPIWGSWLKN